MSFWREYGQKELDKCQHKIGNFAELIIIYKSIHLVPFIDREREREETYYLLTHLTVGLIILQFSLIIKP